MELIFSGILIGLFLLCTALLALEGLWTAAIMFINTVIASMIAVMFFEPLAALLQSYAEWGTFFWDVITLLGLFAISAFALRELTDRLAPKMVRLPELIDRVGGAIFGAMVGAFMVCFIASALQTAPLAPKFMFEGFKPNEPYLFGMAQPDSYWLSFMKMESNGAFAPLTAAEGYEGFDSEGFVKDYEEKRTMYQAEESIAAGMSGVTTPGNEFGY
ncbi:Hypothetical protein PBC10988_29340 [Planctomycetales bacterium 10988]|nr:Hypothetical protein PBC10988_29340 [Planctomycetales bacterium 10988]